MADLPTIAQRLNDTEVSANAPLTETFFRRVGSNVNFLLDFLGVSNGETTPSGSLNDLAQAVEAIEGDTMTLEATLSGTGIQPVGSFSTTKFINRVFYIYAVTASTSSDVILGNTGGSSNFAPLLNIDAGGNQELPLFKKSNPLATTEFTNANSHRSGLGLHMPTSVRTFSKLLNNGSYRSAAGEGITTSTQFLMPFAEIDWRDSGTNFDLLVDTSIGSISGITLEIYSELVLNVGSSGF